MNIPDYATIRHEGRTPKQLAKVDAHNRRLMETPNARNDVSKDPARYVLKGETLLGAVQEIIAKAGAAEPYGDQHIAFEVIAQVRRNSGKPMPSEAEFTENFDAYLREEHGDALIAARYIHVDETTLHGHAVLVPLTTGRRRGRYAKRKKPVPVVSWNKYSGSEGRKHCGKRYFKNAVMSGWQTRWAEKWGAWGFRRGIPSSREITPIKRFQGQASTVMEVAEAAVKAALAAIKLPNLSPLEVSKLLTSAGRAQVEAVISEACSGKLEEGVAFLRELALRGFQLDSERSARVELEARALAAEAKAVELTKSSQDTRKKVSALEANLKDRDEQIASFNNGEFYRSLSVAQLEIRKTQLEHELELRHIDPEPKRPVVPPLPKPGGQIGQSPNANERTR